MREKKIRGIKRKMRRLIELIHSQTEQFPTDFYKGYWNAKLPTHQMFIDSNKTPKKVRKLCIQTIIDRVERLIQLKPNDGEKYRVMVAINLPNLWYSQVVVFKGEEHFDGFFDRKEWIELSDKRDIPKEWQLSIPKELQVKGYEEIVQVEDGFYHCGELWFIGEIE